jgi:acetyl-CoA C-acetyltransferase
MRTGLALGEHRIEDANLVDGLLDAYGGGHMGLGGEKAAECCALTREDQDRFAVHSYEKALRAQKEGAFDAEIVTVEVPGRKGAVTTVAKDETPRETSLDALAKLAPAFKPGGTVTAGNASKLNDGAAALVVASADRARELRAAPIARVIAQAQYAREPELYLLAPSGAIARVLERAGWTVDSVDLFEVNEAFSGIEGVRRELGIPDEKFNVNGGAVALGHPIGASGARILGTMIYELRRNGGGLGLAAICSGGGQGDAVLIQV